LIVNHEIGYICFGICQEQTVMSENYDIIKTSNFDEKLIRSWEKAYPNFKYKFPQRFEWLHVDNPLIAFMPKSIIYIKEDEEAVAWTSVIYHRLKVHGQEVAASFGADTFTLDSARGKGYASMIQKMTTDNVDAQWAISSSPANNRIFIKIGFTEGVPLKRYFKILTSLSKKYFYNSAIEIGSRKNGLVKIIYQNTFIIGFVFKLSNFFFGNKKALISKTEIKLEIFSEFNEEHDRIFDEIKNEYDLITVRDSSYLEWRYNKEPYFNYKKFNIFFDNKVIGYLVYRVGDELQDFEGVVNEFVLLDEYKDHTSEILMLLEESIRKDGARSICIASSVKSFSNQLDQSGYMHYADFVPILHLRESFKAKVDAPAAISEHEKWFMSYGDHDLDSYGPHLKQPDFSFLLRKIITEKLLLK
jgi:hypothetical protein